jgi:CxxC motif-containing protein (DUF1111 family)
VPMPSNVPGLADWKTPPLWGVADSVPYMHDGSSPTLEDAIEKHGGDAKHSRKKFKEGINKEDRENLITFLKALRAPSSGKAVAQVDEE